MSDSGCVDNAVEFLVMAGKRSLPEVSRNKVKKIMSFFNLKRRAFETVKLCKFSILFHQVIIIEGRLHFVIKSKIYSLESSSFLIHIAMVVEGFFDSCPPPPLLPTQCPSPLVHPLFSPYPQSALFLNPPVPPTPSPPPPRHYRLVPSSHECPHFPLFIRL